MIKIIKIPLSLSDSQSLSPLSLSLSRSLHAQRLCRLQRHRPKPPKTHASAGLNVTGLSRPKPPPTHDPRLQSTGPRLQSTTAAHLSTLSLRHRPKPPITNVTGPDEICEFLVVVGDAMVAAWGLWVFVGDRCCAWFGVCWWFLQSVLCLVWGLLVIGGFFFFFSPILLVVSALVGCV